MKRKWDVSSKEVRRQCIDEIIARVKDQQSEEFGLVATGDVLDLVLQNIGPDIYNLAIKDATQLISNHFTDLEIALDMLEQTG